MKVPAKWRYQMKISVNIILFALIGFSFCACDEGAIACQSIYNECESLITVGEDTFVDNCVDEYHDEDNQCKDALRFFADCAQDKSCTDVGCLDDYLNIGVRCGFDALGIPFFDQ